MIFSHRDLLELAELLRQTAQQEIMPRFRNLAAGAIRTKSGPTDLVTDADEAAEREIVAVLEQRFPGAALIGEEACADDPRIMDRLGDADLAFVIDPIDGTSNYAAGVPVFGVMVAVIARAEIIAGAIHDPICDETALALRGEGAFALHADGRQTALRVANPAAVGDMVGAISWRFLPADLRAVVCRNLPKLAAGFSYRCSALEYRLAAAGHCHFLFYNRLMPWDHASGWLLHREAGGHSAAFDGSPYSPARRTGGLICAPDPHSWQALRDALLERAP